MVVVLVVVDDVDVIISLVVVEWDCYKVWLVERRYEKDGNWVAGRPLASIGINQH